MTDGPEYIEVVTRYRLWAAVPPEERVTADDLRPKYTRQDGTVVTDGNPYYEAAIRLLANPHCIVALQPQDMRGKWMPCKNPVADGDDRCKRHGGASTSKTPPANYVPKAALQAEVERLRALVASHQGAV